MTSMFIQIGSTNIKKSTIKQFGVGREERTDMAVENLVHMVIATVGLFAKGVRYVVRSSPAKKAATAKFWAINTPKTHREYLYVTTYHGDNHKFYEDAVERWDAAVDGVA